MRSTGKLRPAIEAFGPFIIVALVIAASLYATSNSVKAGPYRNFWSALDIARSRMMNPAHNRPLMLGDSVMYIGIVGVMVLVFVNTLIITHVLTREYRNESSCGVCFSPAQEVARVGNRGPRIWALRLLASTLLLIGMWLLLSYFGFFFAAFREIGDWQFPADQQKGHEIVSLAVFGLFLIVDLLLSSARNREIAFWEEIHRAPQINSHPNVHDAREQVAHKINSLRNERRFQIDSICFIDLPVFIGVFAIVGLHFFLDDNRFYILANRDLAPFDAPMPPVDLDLHRHAEERDGLLPPTKPSPFAAADALGVCLWPTCAEKVSYERQLRRFEGFLQGFATGGVMMHIAMSQLIFGVLLFRFLRSEQVPNHGKPTASQGTTPPTLPSTPVAHGSP